MQLPSCLSLLNPSNFCLVKRTFFFFFFLWGNGPQATVTGPFYQKSVMDVDECGMLGRETEVFGENLLVLLCPPQILHDPTRARTQAAVVGSQRLTA
jgi:hypothetical protein